MRTVLYGELVESRKTFKNHTRKTIVMLPALGVPSPNIYMKPLAEALTTTYNVVVIEPFGYGLAEITEMERTVEHLNIELYEALERLEIDSCILLVHSFAGVYGMRFLHSYPQKVRGVIAIENTVYSESLSEGMAAEQSQMLRAMKEFDLLRNSFENLADFRRAIKAEPLKYGAELPKIVGYEYDEKDREEYYDAYARSCNQTIQNEIENMNLALESIKDIKFPSTLPVLVLLSSDNVAAMPEWKTTHQEQLDIFSGKHNLISVQGNHYIWYTNLADVVKQIVEWDDAKA